VSDRRALWSCLLLALGMSWWSPDSAEAQFTRDRPFEAGFFLGSLSIDHDLGSVSNLFFTTTGSADDIPFGTDFWGARFSVDLTPDVAVEGTYSRARQTFFLDVADDLDAGDVPLGGQFEATQQNIAGNVVVQVPLEFGLIPYGTIGYSFVKTNPTNEIGGFTSDSSRGLNFGGGAKYFYPGAPWVGARFDLRWQRLSEGLAFGDQIAEPRNTELTIGVAFRF